MKKNLRENPKKFSTVITKNTFYFYNPTFQDTYEGYIHSLNDTLFVLKNKALLFSLLLFFTYFNGINQTPFEFKILPTSATIWSDTVNHIGTNMDYILQDRKGYYWFASNGDGVYLYDGKTLIHITEKNGLLSNYVWSIDEDINGILWFSTRDGVCSFNGSHFSNFSDIIKNAPKGKIQFSKGGLFFGHLNGICYYNGFSFFNFAIHPVNYKLSTSDMARSYSIYSSFIDDAGNAWFGTQSEGVGRFDGKNIVFFTDKHLAGPAVRTIFQDKKGIMWFGNNGGGLFRFDGKTLTNITEEKGLGNPEFLKGHFNNKLGSLARVWTMNDDQQGNLWIGTIDAGIWKFDGKNLTNYTTKDGLAGNAIWKIFKDHKGELWIITNGDAICKFNGKTFYKYSFH